VSGRPERYAVVGDPVAHSASPRLFAALGRHLGRVLDYRTERIGEGEFPSFLARVRQGAYRGLSVTLPHTEATVRLADEASLAARAVGAANTLVLGAGGRLLADNTDGVGLLRALAWHGVSLKDKRVLVLGAGGAARAAVHAARTAGARAVHVSNRTQGRAEQLATALGAVAVPLEAPVLQPVLEAADVLVQASAAGLSRPGETALPVGCVLHPRLTVLDMVYQPLETALLRDARAAGARPIDGLWMLIHQGLEQLRLWTEVEAQTDLAARVHAELSEALP
jgi:shikimate dehydrogenase